MHSVNVRRAQALALLLAVAGIAQGCLSESRRSFFSTCTSGDQCLSGTCFEALCTTTCTSAAQCGATGVCLKGHCAPQPARIDLFRDEFADSAMAGWMPYGSPQPKWMPLFADHTGVVDTNGDGSYNSGMASKALVVCDKGCMIESEMYAGFSNPGGCWSEASLGLADAAYATLPISATSDVIWEAVGVVVSGVGDKCWASPIEEHGHTWLQAWARTEGGGTEYSAMLPADAYANRWTRLAIAIGADRIVRVLADGKPVWASSKPVDAEVLKGRNLMIGRRSSGSAGKCYHDWVWAWR